MLPILRIQKLLDCYKIGDELELRKGKYKIDRFSATISELHYKQLIKQFDTNKFNKKVINTVINYFCNRVKQLIYNNGKEVIIKKNVKKQSI